MLERFGQNKTTRLRENCGFYFHTQLFTEYLVEKVTLKYSADEFAFYYAKEMSENKSMLPN